MMVKIKKIYLLKFFYGIALISGLLVLWFLDKKLKKEEIIFFNSKAAIEKNIKNLDSILELNKKLISQKNLWNFSTYHIISGNEYFARETIDQWALWFEKKAIGMQLIQFNYVIEPIKELKSHQFEERESLLLWEQFWEIKGAMVNEKKLSILFETIQNDAPGFNRIQSCELNRNTEHQRIDFLCQGRLYVLPQK